MSTTFEQDKILANDVLERHYYKSFREGNNFKTLEIFLLGACRSNCEYCYLKQHLNDLYPIKLHNYDTIVHNFELIIDWYIENKFRCGLEIFSGEWLTTPIADRIIDVLYNKFKDVPDYYKPPRIICADNMQFLKNDAIVEKVESYIERLDSIHIPLVLSCSVDGKYCDDGRTPNDDAFYQKLKMMIDKYHWLLHPMVSADNAKHWIENFLWIEETFGKDVLYQSTYLEVRNGDWDESSINDLIRFCDFLIDKAYADLGQSGEELLKYIFNLKEQEDESTAGRAYNPIRIIYNGFIQSKDNITCSFGHSLVIRAADLKVGPCHRTFYPDLELGQYNVENDKITDFTPFNVSLLIGKQYVKKSCLPICEHCGFVGICTGFCFGASYEDYGNMFVPQKEVCDLYKAKFIFIFYKLKCMGLLDDLSVLENNMSPELFRYYKDLIFSSLEEAGL